MQYERGEANQNQTATETGRALEAAAPEVLASPLRAARLYREGATTSHGKPVFDENGRQVRYSGTDAAKRALGFQPVGQSERTEVAMTGKKLQEWWNSERTDLLDALRAAHTPAARRDVTREIMTFNRDLRQSQAFGPVSIITADSVRSALTARPDKKKISWQRQHSTD